MLCEAYRSLLPVPLLPLKNYILSTTEECLKNDNCHVLLPRFWEIKKFSAVCFGNQNIVTQRQWSTMKSNPCVASWRGKKKEKDPSWSFKCNQTLYEDMERRQDLLQSNNKLHRQKWHRCTETIQLAVGLSQYQIIMTRSWPEEFTIKTSLHNRLTLLVECLAPACHLLQHDFVQQ